MQREVSGGDEMRYDGPYGGGQMGPLTAQPTDSIDREDKPPRDWKRAVLIFGLGLLSWVATYVGMMELIEANLGDLPVTHRIIIAFSVAMLMVMIIWLLDQMFKPQPFMTRAFYCVGYLFLTLISVGFGFGFYWKVLESRGEATRSAESAITQVQASLAGASTRLTQLEATLVQLATVSSEKAELERTKGASCPNSRPGDGPRRRMRDDDAAKFNFASQFVGQRATTVKADIGGLDGDLAKIISADPSTFDAKTGTRNDFLRQVGRRLDLTSARFNAFRTDPQLRQIRSDLDQRSQQSTFSDGKGGTISCPDAQLQGVLAGVVKAIDQLPTLQKSEISVVEGSEATIEAFRRLTTTLAGALTFKLPPSADELRDLQKKAIQSFENAGTEAASQKSASNIQGGLSQRDYVPLGVALFVDFCLFLVSLVQRPVGRLNGLMPKMHAAERGPIIQILSRFNEIHHDRQVRENFEIFRHVVFDMNGDYYAAVPLDAPPRLNPEQREQLRIEAQLLANLFASFEKEKIFKRTLLPTRASIQKRLHRQGSKFAGSEAFRVYKFADGAWSEIILGAVMGAARRMERTSDDVRTTTFQNSSATPRYVPVNDDHAAPSTQTRESLAATSSSVGAAPVSGNSDIADLGAMSGIPQAAVMTATRGGARPGSLQAALALDPDHVSRFGPYADAYRPSPPPYATAPQGPRVPWPAPPPLPEADVDVAGMRHSKSNQVTVVGQISDESGDGQTSADTDSDTARIVQLPRHAPIRGEFSERESLERTEMTHSVRPRTDDQQTSIVLSRDTATFTVPVSAAALPRRLTAALAAMRDTNTSDTLPFDFGSQTTREHVDNDIDAVLGPQSDSLIESDADYDDDVAVEDDFTADDRALIGRMAPPAAE